MKRILAVLLALVLVLSCGAIAENSDYSQGKAYFAAQSFDAAQVCFKAAGAYDDAAEYIDYINVIKLGLNGLYAPAASTIGNLYSALDDAANYITYFTALSEIEDGDYATAETLISSLNGFYNSASLQDKINAAYQQGQVNDAAAALNAGNWDAAIARYTALGDTEMVKETYYRKAEALSAAGNFAAAADVYASIIGYKDTVSKLARMEELEGITAEFAVGNTVTFGNYVKNGSVVDHSWDGKKEDLEWIVLAVEDSKALLITKDIIDSQIYAASGDSADDDADVSDIPTYVTWYSSNLRSWLNDYFYYDAFDASEQALIVSTTVKAEANPDYLNSSIGPDTTDKVFVLSISELRTYFATDSDRMAKVTQYAARMRGAGSNDTGYGWYWVRNAGKSYFYAATCLRDGSIGTKGNSCNTTYIGVRPAIWVTIY